MLARTPSTSTRNLIGFGALIAAAAIFAPSGKAQQLAANADITADRGAYLAAQCDHLASDPPRHAGCYAEKSIEFSRAQIAAARKSADEHRKATAEHQEAIAKSDAAIAEHQKATDASRVRAQCLTDITTALKATPPRITVDAVRAARTAAPDNPCAWATQLGVRSQRHGALSKQ